MHRSPSYQAPYPGSSNLQYYQQAHSTPGATYSSLDGGHRRNNSFSGGTHYYPTSSSAHGHSRHRSASHSHTGHAPTYYVTPSTHPTHHSSSSRHHRRSHSTGAHGHRSSSRSSKPITRSYTASKSAIHSTHYRQPSLAERIRHFFGFGHSKERYVDPRTGREVDRHGRPVVRY
ncbi:uncharacterized protein STEHIDRAFT_120468 [Stereum hirsutum FP-91666 SS1]|uniref:uncharacterized protein n=1 Tax=Stereum hirsutum (strain FP-91666) TaxID=721885 RepID=UPI000440FEDB|nr:uncharacterized protein STEHIDRAFT_120468 [Stereum hirsutum FP-91666 SS1]EIM88268.1 hypothetical protein STEHIDRAFT_120468 [Stereum hirsutum FP-91666 SS1]